MRKINGVPRWCVLTVLVAFLAHGIVEYIDPAPRPIGSALRFLVGFVAYGGWLAIAWVDRHKRETDNRLTTLNLTGK